MIMRFIGKGAETLLPELDAAELRYSQRTVDGRRGVKDILQLENVSLPAVANALVSWRNARPTGGIVLKSGDDVLRIIQRQTPVEVEQLLHKTSTILVTDMCVSK